MPVYNASDENKTQDICKVCKVNTTNKPEDEAVECDVCLQWICFPCSGISKELFDFANTTESEIAYICKACKDELPQVRDIIVMKQKQEALSEKVNTEAQVNKRFRVQQVTVNQLYDKRLQDIEEIIRDKKLADKNFPTLPVLTVQAETIKQVVAKQQTLQRKVEAQKVHHEEEKRREDNQNSLIVYGVPEHAENETDQMKEDFNTVKHIYDGKATLNSRDFIHILRLGKTKDPVKIRPIKLVFANQEKRLEILRNNKNLVLEGDEFAPCSAEFCEDKAGKHKHIYVSPDKTKQQREEEKKLREELKRRKETEEDPDLIIRNGKIIKKTATRARWVDLFDNV